LKCKIENCELEVKTKGYCGKHYVYLKRHSLLTNENLNKCKIEGCENLEYAREMCHQHYRYHLRKGLIDLDAIKICKVEGCNEKMLTNGYCNRHMMQIRAYGKILERTHRDLNEIIIYDDFAEVVLYDKNNNEIAQALIDVDIVDKVKEFKWSISGRNYVVCSSNKIKLHDLVMDNYEKIYIIDHIDRNPLNNMKHNLRFATIQQNQFNKGKLENKTSKYKGVSLVKSSGKWKARIRFNDELIQLGNYMNEADAGRAYDKKAKELFGEFAYLNFPDE
jgi:hypothetical protein